MSLKEVRAHVKCSNSTVYKAFYQQIDLELRKSQNPWPKTLGIDEHSFNRNVKRSKDSIRREFVSVFIDYTNKRMREVTMGKSIADLLSSSIVDIPGRQNVKNVITDLSPTYRSFVEDFFPSARIIADKFHVVKLMHPELNRLRRETVEMYLLNRRRGNPVNKLIYKYHRKLNWTQKSVMKKFLFLNEDLEELYWYQQKLYTVYRVKGYKRAKKILYSLFDDMSKSKQKRVLSYRKTLMRWSEQILNYFKTNGLNNGRTEGYNCKAKLIQRCAYGFRSFTNYRLKLLYHCR
jgi:transposase